MKNKNDPKIAGFVAEKKNIIVFLAGFIQVDVIFLQMDAIFCISLWGLKRNLIVGQQFVPHHS